MVRSDSTEAEYSRSLQQFRSVADALSTPLFLLDPGGNVMLVNDAFRNELDIDRCLTGSSISVLDEASAIPSADVNRLEEAISALTQSESGEREVVLHPEQQEDLLVRLEQVHLDDGTALLGKVQRDTGVEHKMDVLKRQREAMFRLYDIEMNDELSIDEKIQKTIDVGREFFDLPIGFLTSIDGTDHRFKQVLGSDELVQGDHQPLENTYCRLIIERDEPLVLQDAEVELGEQDPAYVKYGLRSYIGSKIMFGSNVYGTFCFSGSDPRERSFTDIEQEFVQMLGMWAGYQIQRQFVEDMLRQLNDLGRQLMLAESDQRIGELLLDTVLDVFEMSAAVCFRYDEPSDTLQQLAEKSSTREVDEQVLRISSERTVHVSSFKNGDVRTFEHLSPGESQSTNGDRFKSVVHVPIGNEGLLVAASTKYDTMPSVFRESFQLLSEITRDAFLALGRKEQLQERGEALQRQNERLEEFAGLVAHDLRNPLSGAFGFLEIARETKDKIHFDRIESTLDRLQDLIGKLLALARGTEADMDPTDLKIEDVLREAWTYLETKEANLNIAGDPGWVRADETRLLQLFGNLIRNSIEHVGGDVTVEVGPLENGFYLSDDGPGLPEDVRNDVLTLGRTRSDDRPGLGLGSVTDIVDEHDWTLEIPKTEQGARFEIYTG